MRFAAFPNPHDPAAAAVEPIDPRWSIQVIDSARFAEFGYPHAVVTDPTPASASPSSTTTTPASAPPANAGADAAADECNFINDEPEAAIHEPEQTQPAQSAVAAGEEELHAPDLDDTKKAFAAEPVKLHVEVEQIVPPNEPGKNDRDPRAVPGKLPCITPRTCLPIYAAAPRSQGIKSRLFDFERNPAFNRQRMLAKQRRAAAAAPSKTPIWKL